MLLRLHRGWRAHAEIELPIRLRSLCSATAQVVRLCPITLFSGRGLALLRGMALGTLPSSASGRKKLPEHVDVVIAGELALPLYLSISRSTPISIPTFNSMPISTSK